MDRDNFTISEEAPDQVRGGGITYCIALDAREIFCGNCHWSLDLLVQFEEGRRGWVSECFPDPEDPYDKHWHNKLAFLEVGNGDFLTIDLSEQKHGEIVYLSHDDGDGHGFRLAESFEDWVVSWSQLACVGAEDWQWLPFYDREKAVLDSYGQAAADLRQWLGLEPLSKLSLV